MKNTDLKNLKQDTGFVKSSKYGSISFVIEDTEFTFPVSDNRGKLADVQKRNMSLPVRFMQERNAVNSSEILNLSPMHHHASYELFYVDEGKVIVEYETGKVIVDEKRVHCTAPNVKHRIVYQSKGSKAFFLIFSIKRINTGSDFGIYDIIADNIAPYAVFEASCECGEHLTRISHLVDRLLPNRDNLTTTQLLKIVNRAMLEFVSELQSQFDNNPIDSVAYSGNNDSRLYRLNQFVSSNYNRDITIDDVAEEIFLSQRQTLRIIKEYYGCSFKQLLKRIRIEQAAGFLISTDFSVEEIGERVGYSSRSGFFEAFCDIYEMSPAQYRKKYKAL